MNRNITIVIIILILVVIAGYLVWLRSRYMAPVSPQPVDVQEEIMSTPTTSPIEATGSMQEEEATKSMEEESSPSSSKR